MEDGHHMEENIAKFGEKLKQLVAHSNLNHQLLCICMHLYKKAPLL